MILPIHALNYKFNLESNCPQECQNCKTGGSSDGGMPINSKGICEYFCSEGGYCGNGEDYKSGVDCTGCRKGKLLEENKLYIRFTA